jgi:hypothetical protein
MKTLLASVGAASFLLISTTANAQATRTWVSGVGDDVNPCSRTAPCKTFAGAISKTATGGEINCLDPAGYGSVNITKAMTIDCNYTHGSILAANVNGVLINAPNTASVTLRGLSINGAATTTGNGVRILAGRDVNIDGLVIENFGGNGPSQGRGITIETTAGTINVTIQNTRIYNANFMGIHSNPTGGLVNLSIDNVQIARSGTGMQFRQLTQAVINNTSSTNNPGAALAMELSSVSTNISNSNLSNSAFGIINGNGGTPATRLYGTTITGNTTAGLQINGGAVTSLGNNMIQGNAGNQTPTSDIGTD